MRIQFALALLAATDCSPISASVDVDARKGRRGNKGGWGHKGAWSGKGWSGKDWSGKGWSGKAIDWQTKVRATSGFPMSPASPISTSSSVQAATPQKTPIAAQLTAKSPSDATVDNQSQVQSAAPTLAQSLDAKTDQTFGNGIDGLMEKLKDSDIEENIEKFKTEILPMLWDKLKIMSQMKRDSHGKHRHQDENRSLKTAELYIRMIASLVFILCALAFLCLGCFMANKGEAYFLKTIFFRN